MTDLIEQYVDKGRFTDLFVEELGWDRPRRSRDLTVSTDNGEVTLSEAATFKGITVWVCPSLPDGRAQRLIDREVKKESNERLLIFRDGDRQEWRWPQTRNAQGAGSTRLVRHDHIIGRDNPALAQRLAQIEIGLDEDSVSVVEVTRRLKKAFDADKVTKKFYGQFKSQHDALCGAIEGIDRASEKDSATSEVRWYGSLLMNRIMFIYFMQKKGFLDNDRDYLRSRLDRIRQTERADSPGTFYDFYKHFLLPLFHHGLGHPDTSNAIDDPVIADLVGDIPYVNGGIFSIHPIEAANNIAIGDHVFEALFDFLDGWQWHLDDRPSGDPNEINPDVLGYIFEQFINNKQQGAYYTKEDVTGYMTENTLIPVFLDRLADATGINPWQHLTKQPDRYIWDSVTHGMFKVDEHGNRQQVPLPERVAAEQDGLHRPTWDEDPGPGYALPGESWWEVVQRRKRATALMDRLHAVKSTDNAITVNIDLQTLAVDVIDAVDSPEDVVAVWAVLKDIKVVDPTCGSGAFLFAALTVLHALYAAVLDAAKVHSHGVDSEPLEALIAKAAQHSSRDYFVLKFAALNNIYGVDLMPEAVEIARLRLFLKLIAQVGDRSEIEPLPDLEFNIRPGNILVGAVDADSIRAMATIETAPLAEEVIDQAAEAAGVYQRFSSAQTEGDADEIRGLRDELRHVNEEATKQLHGWWFERDRKASGSADLELYLNTHRPFHWNVEFPEIFSQHGGFDVVIGNPPYVSAKEVNYHYEGFATDQCADIYAPCTERAVSILRDGGMISFIVPHSLVYSGRYSDLRSTLERRLARRWTASFARIPASLFGNTVRVRNTILLGSKKGTSSLSTSRCRRWVADYRPHLMENIKYVTPSLSLDDKWPMVDEQAVVRAFEKMRDAGLGTFGGQASGRESRAFKYPLYYRTNAYSYLSVFIDIPPVTNADGSLGEQSEMNSIWFRSEEERDIAYALGISRLMYAWWRIWGDDFHVTKEVVVSLPVGPHNLDAAQRAVVLGSVPTLRAMQTSSATFKKNAGKKIGNWDLSAVRDQIDVHEREWLDAMGFGHMWPALRVSYSTANPLTD